jgi:dTDP-D-glucose 4,6-dehydratase
MNYLVTGAAGFMGSNYVRHLRGRDDAANIIVLDALTYAGNLQNLAGLLPPSNIVVPELHQELKVVACDLRGNHGPVPSSLDVLERWTKKMSGHPLVSTDQGSLSDAVRSRIKRQGAFVFVLGSTTDAGIVRALMPLADYVVNFAAETHVDRSISDPSVFLRNDVIGVQTMLDAARECPSLRRFIQISTDEVYGSVEAGSCT